MKKQLLAASIVTAMSITSVYACSPFENGQKAWDKKEGAAISQNSQKADQAISAATSAEGAAASAQGAAASAESEATNADSEATNADSKATDADSKATKNASSIKSTNKRLNATTNELHADENRLYSDENQINQNTSAIKDNEAQIQSVKRSVAMNTALTGIHYISGPHKFQVATSAGVNQSDTAVAVGMAYQPAPNWLVDAQVAMSTDKDLDQFAGSVGTTYAFG